MAFRYVSGRLGKTLAPTSSEHHRSTTMLTAFVYPGKFSIFEINELLHRVFAGSVFAMFFFLNLLAWAKGSSGAVPFTTMFAVDFCVHPQQRRCQFSGTGSLVRDFRPSRLPRRSSSLQARPYWFPLPSELDPPTNSATALVPEALVAVPRRWYPPIRCCLYGALLHHELLMAAPVLLSLRVRRSGVSHPHHHLCGGVDSSDLFPANC